MANRLYSKIRPRPSFKRKNTVGRPSKKSDAPFSDDVQQEMIKFLDDELSIAKRNTKTATKDFKEYYNMIHCVRVNDHNEWESDIYLPEFVSRLLTNIGNFVSQYFSSSDFVEPAKQSEDPSQVAEANASKRLLNNLLNKRNAYYFQKIIRLLMFVFPGGFGYIKGGYKQTRQRDFAGYRTELKYARDTEGNFMAEDGSPFTDSLTQKPKFEELSIPIYNDKIVDDRPVFDVYPTQYVHVSPEYVYSLQDKRHVYFETENILDELYESQEFNGYFNLHLLKDLKPDVSEHAKKTYNVDGDKELQDDHVSPPFVIYERWGTFPCIDIEKNVLGKIVSAKPGIDKTGTIMDNAENIECIITLVEMPGSGSAEPGDTKPYQIIRFQPSPYTKRPMVRFQCYIDALKDEGFGDGEVTKELQIASNDMYNLSNFRTQLATTPAFKGKKFAGIPSKITISPDKVIELDNLDDLQEVVIRDDINGAMTHLAHLSSRMDFAMATSPNTMGVPSGRRETATVGSIMDQRASIRIGMKSMSLEMTGFVEFYDMLLSLCDDFMLPETLNNLAGEYARFYRPGRENQFKPVSQAIETEESKRFKTQMWDQILGRVVAIPNPKTPMVVNYIIGQILELNGGDFKIFKRFMFEEDPVANFLYMIATSTGHGQAQAQGGGGNAPGGPSPTSNEQGLLQSGAEQMVRGAANEQ